MQEKLRSWWQKIKQHQITILVVAIILVIILAFIFAAYRFGWSRTGFLNKSLWDWLQLLIVPLVLAIGGFWFSQMQRKTEQRITTDNQHEAALQAYIDKISDLLLKEHLAERTVDGQLKPEYEQVRNVARVQTITVLNQLDARRIGYVFTFLGEAGLMSPPSNDNVVSLRDADLRAVNWRGANLCKANLCKANLNGVDLCEAFLSEANLNGADLSQADLRGAFLTGADLSEAFLNDSDLRGANLKGASGISVEELEKQASSLKDAIMPDGTKHP